MRKALKFLSYILVALLAALLGLLILATSLDYRPAEKEKAVTVSMARQIRIPDSTLTLVTWNLGYFGLGKDVDFFYDGGKMTRPGEEQYRRYAGTALDYIRNHSDADVYFFQEADLRSRRSYHDDQVALLSIELPDHSGFCAVNYQVPFVPVPLFNPMGRVKSGLATFLRMNTTENTRHAFFGGYSWPVRLFMLDRCFLLSRVPLPSGKDLVLINTHNEAFDDGSQRKSQLEHLRQVMLDEFEKGNYVVTGGDWNMNPVGFDPANITTGDATMLIEPAIDPGFMPEGWQWVYDPKTPSNRAVDQPYRKGTTPVTIIDFFVTSPNIQVISIETDYLGFGPADHHPVKMEIKPD